MTRPPRPFQALEYSLNFLRLVRPLIDAIGRHDKSLKDQLRRAAQSIHLNLSESRGFWNGHRVARIRTALGSAYECRGALEVADAFGYIAQDDAHRALVVLDSLIAMLYRIANPRR